MLNAYLFDKCTQLRYISIKGAISITINGYRYVNFAVLKFLDNNYMTSLTPLASTM